jgi:hypothetical protein
MNSTSNQTISSTDLNGRETYQVNFEDVSDRLTGMKIGIKKNAVVDDLANALASEWESNRTHGPHSKIDTDMRGTS